MTDRLKVGAEFCGWPTLEKIVNAATNKRDAFLILTLFKTGGRVSEVLQLTKSTFDFATSDKSIIIRQMIVGKKFERREGKTVKIEATRTIPILKKELLSDKYLELFNSRHHKLMFSGNHVGKAMTRDTALKIVVKAGASAGIRVNAHWFRGQRASQLAEEYGFGVYELNQFFGWGARNPRNMAERYASLGWRGLEQRMLRSGAL